jgi:hypothetical protein
MGLAIFPAHSQGQGWGTPDDPGRARHYLSIMGGSFTGEDNPGQLEEEGAQFSLGVGIGYRPRPFLALEGDLFLFERSYAAPPAEPFPFYYSSDRMEVRSAGFLFTVKGRMLLKRFHPYAGAGLGLYHSEATVREVLLVIPGEKKRRETGPGVHLVAGADFALSRLWTIGIEFREVRMRGDLGDFTHENVELGGRSILLTGRRSF